MMKRPDYDGCRRACRTGAHHTLVPGECAHAPEPEETVSISKICTDTDGAPSTGFDTYTLQQLADLIEPALRSVTVSLGPNALHLLEAGHSIGLSEGEYHDMALSAAQAIRNRNKKNLPENPANN